jgi:hypothetical protein
MGLNTRFRVGESRAMCGDSGALVLSIFGMQNENQQGEKKNWEGLSLQAKQRSAPPKKTRACLSQAPTKRGVCASLPAAILPVDAPPLQNSSPSSGVTSWRAAEPSGCAARP